jgi:HD-like signal output (HDOD) protein
MQANEDLKATAFQFAQQLANDLNNSEFELPGFPDVVMRLHKILADENSSVADIVKLVSSEPSLAARLIQLANSAAFNADGQNITDPRTAIQRLGFNVVRGSATSFAIKQLENQEWLMPVRSELAAIWRRSNFVAATSYSLGEVTAGVRSDEALAAGLFHQIGNLYLLARGHKEGIQVSGNPDWDEVVSGWHPTIARSILENWDMPESIAVAVENQDGVMDNSDGDLSELTLLTRLLSASKLYDILKNEPDRAQPGWKELLIGVRLSGESFGELIERGREKMEAVSQTIG